MELRHLRFFIVLAEELHFTRAAERLHIEQPPLSRAIKELEEELEFTLFIRSSKGTRLTPAGKSFLRDARRLFASLQRAKDNASAVASGQRGSLHIAISDGATDPRLSSFLARCRIDEPEIEVRLTEVTMPEQLRGLRSGDYALGLAHTGDVGDDLVAEAIWQDPFVAVIPARHPLLAFKEIELGELSNYPLILCDPSMRSGFNRELARLLKPLETNPDVAEYVSSLEMMLTFVGAGYGVGFTTLSRTVLCKRPDIVIRPLASHTSRITTYLLRLRNMAHSPISLDHFINRLRNPL